MSAEVKRIYPGDKNGLIDWMESNYHEIESYISSFKMKDGTLMTIYSNESVIEALGMLSLSKDTIRESSHEGRFIPRREKIMFTFQLGKWLFVAATTVFLVGSVLAYAKYVMPWEDENK